MTTLRLLAALVMAACLTLPQIGCTATQVTVDFHADIAVPGLGSLSVTVHVQSGGTQVFSVHNPNSESVWIQPKDANGNPIGPPLEVPPGGSVDLPPGADSDHTGVVKKPEPPKPPKPVEPKPKESAIGLSLGLETQSSAVVIEPLLQSWPGVNTSFPANGNSKINEYRIAARNAGGALDALNKLDMGLAAHNAELVAATEILPLSSTTAQFTTTMASNKIAQFEVYVNGVLVASSVNGLGGATIVYGSDGYGTGTATFLLDFAASGALIQWVTTDSLGVQTTRKYDYNK